MFILSYASRKMMKKSLSKEQKRIIIGTFLGLVACLFVIFFISQIRLFHIFELKTLDFRFFFRGNQSLPKEPEVVIVAIDEESVRQLGRWPWPRDRHAQLIDVISKGDPRLIFFDVFFVEEDREHPENDRALAEAVQRAGNVYFDYFFIRGKPQEELEIANPESLDLLYERAFPLKQAGKESTAWVDDVTVPIFPIVRNARGVAHATLKEDDDDIYRKFPLVIKFKDRLFPGIPLLLAKDYLRIKNEDIRIDLGKELTLGDRNVPIDEEAQMMVNFHGSSGTFRYIPYAQVLEEKIPPEFFKDKIVLVGATAPGIFDIRITPLGHMPGLEIIANSFTTILEGNFIHKLSSGWMVLIILFLGLLTGFVASYFRLSKGALLVLFLLGAYIGITTYLFEAKGVWVEMVSPGLAIALSWTTVLGYRYLTEEKEKKKYKDTFQRYVSKSIVDEIMKDTAKIKLGGEKRVMSVLFSDIRGFTTFAESATPEEVVGRLNEYMGVMVDVLFKYDGTLDKFVGDEIMALFGAPVSYKDHAKKAVLAGLEMLKELKKLQDKWKAQGKKIIDIGIGVNSGEMNVGNMGSLKIMDYTVIGDNVNLAARLETLTRNYNNHFIISEATYQEVKDIVSVKPLEEVKVKGKTKAVMIYEVLGEK